MGKKMNASNIKKSLKISQNVKNLGVSEDQSVLAILSISFGNLCNGGRCSLT